MAEPDWADEKAREWLAEWLGPRWKDDTHLADLLRDVRFSDRPPYPHWCRDGHEPLGFGGDNERCPACKLRDDLLAEVRRIVLDVRGIWYPAGDSPEAVGSAITLCISEILKRLEAL